MEDKKNRIEEAQEREQQEEVQREQERVASQAKPERRTAEENAAPKTAAREHCSCASVSGVFSAGSADDRNKSRNKKGTIKSLLKKCLY